MIGPINGIGGQAILSLLETPGIKVQIMMIIHVGNSPVCMFGNLLVATLRLSTGIKCHHAYHAELSTGQTVERNKLSNVYHNIH